MYDYFSIEGFRQFSLFYLVLGLPSFLYFYSDRKKRKKIEDLVF